MRKCLKGFSSAMLLPLALLVLMAPKAEAVIQLTLSSGATTLTIDDGDTGVLPGHAVDVNPAVGAITYLGIINTWTLNVTTGSVVSNPNPLIDLNSVNAGSGTGANALTMMFSGTDYVGPGVGFVASIGGTLAGGHSLTYDAYVNDSNLLNATDTQIGVQQSFGPGGAFSGSTVGGTGDAQFSLTQIVVLSATINGTSSFDGNITAVPEPASIALLGGVLVLTSLAIRRKAQASKA